MSSESEASVSRVSGSREIGTVNVARIPRGLSHYVFPAIAAVTAAVFLVQSVNLGFGTLQSPGAGLWPFAVSVITIVLSGVQALLPAVPGAAYAHEHEEQTVESGRSLLLGTMVVVYALLLTSVGYLILTAVLLFCSSFFVARARWWTALITSAISTGLVYLMFSLLLGIPLPAWPLIDIG